MKLGKSRENLAIFQKERAIVMNVERGLSRKAEKAVGKKESVFPMEKAVLNTGIRVLADLMEKEAKVPVRVPLKRENMALPRDVPEGKKSFPEMDSALTVPLKITTGMRERDVFPAVGKGNILSRRIAVLE